MNLMEGLKRIGIVVGCFFALGGASILLLDSAPTAERRADDAARDVIEILWQAQGEDFRKDSTRWSMRSQLWPDMSSAELLDKTCNSKSVRSAVNPDKVQWDGPDKKPWDRYSEAQGKADDDKVSGDVLNRLKFSCDEYAKSGVDIAILWATALGNALGVAFLVGLGWGLLWATFMWIVSGFIRPKLP